ncbi:MAG: sigma-70 family RNA polymerase sigma factor [Planctomycetota bacterium]
MTDCSRERELVQRAQAGDREAFSALLEQSIPALRSFLLRLGVAEDDLDDLAQEVFVVVIRGLKRFRSDSRFSSWVLGIGVNVSRNWRRRRGPPGPLDELPEDPSRNPERQMLAREEGDLLSRALERLPDPLREVFVLRHVERLSAAEMGEILNLPEGTVRRRVHSARERLRALLTPQESRR